MEIKLDFQVVVIGGGLSGICAAVGAARAGAKTVLVHDRPLLGGNGSGVLRIHIAGADCSGGAIARYVRESGVIDELRLENLRRNPADSHDVFSLICRELVEAEPNVTLVMNTRARKVILAGPDRIAGVEADQTTTEKEFVFTGRTFVDCTGDGFVAMSAGAPFRIGREGRAEFDESLAPTQADEKTLPSCVEFYLKDMGKPTPFVPPPWAYRFERDEDLPFRDMSRAAWEFGNLRGGFWWLSAGGDRSTIVDDEEIYRQLLRVLYGIWDHMKNQGDHGAANFALDWVSPIPGKRESRRLEGAYWLTQNDVVGGRVFEDRVAYGGWPVDLHPPEGVFSKDPPNVSVPLARPYTIPLRALYSKRIANLYFAGRDASFTHVALGSARVMGTCGIAGQAADIWDFSQTDNLATARAKSNRGTNWTRFDFNLRGIEPGLYWMWVEGEVSARWMASLLGPLGAVRGRWVSRECTWPQLVPPYQTMRGTFLFRLIPESKPYGPENVVNGTARPERWPNAWISQPLSRGPQWIELSWPEPVKIREMHLAFDGQYDSNVTWPAPLGVFGCETLSPIIKRYDICAGDIVLVSVHENYLSRRTHTFGPVMTESIRVRVHETHGIPEARIDEIRVY